MKYSHLPLALLCCAHICAAAEKPLASPDGSLLVSIEIGDNIRYSVTHGGDAMLAPSPISMTLTGGKCWGKKSHVSSTSDREINETIASPTYKKSSVANHCNERTIDFEEGFSLVFRAYNDGLAYRFVAAQSSPFEVEDEEATFCFPSNRNGFFAHVRKTEGAMEKQFFNSFEQPYSYHSLNDWTEKHMAFTPALIECGKGKKLCIVEADLLSYPGMYLYQNSTSNSLKGMFARYPKVVKQGGHNMLQGLVQSREPYLARCAANATFPWRALIISQRDAELTNSDMVYKLASPSPAGVDFSWVKPGKVAWDWWNDWNLYGVDFKTGINNPTYKAYIDFAAKHGVEYVILDEGWAVNKIADLTKVVPDINLPELLAYAKAKNVGIILWAGYYAFNRDIEGICKRYADMGVKGFKVDFMDRDDQPMVEFHAEAARIAAKHKLLLDFHGTYKPTGLQRTYPNVLNFEGVYGLEQMKWDASADQVTYDVTIPFIRMVAGPMDYTPGAMRNASKASYRAVYSEPMSQGTRCRQLAEYVIFDAPLAMLCDNPSSYEDEPECTQFIADIPTVWDNTIALAGELGKYVCMARQKGSMWYVGALAGWDGRELEVDLSFLGEGKFEAEIFKDGANANRSASDYQREQKLIPASRKLSISMASGGGCAMKIIRKK
jgi:alpha-glucosidase